MKIFQHKNFYYESLIAKIFLDLWYDKKYVFSSETQSE